MDPPADRRDLVCQPGTRLGYAVPLLRRAKGVGMIVVHEARPSDSPYVEGITYGRTESEGSTVRPAECRWHMVFFRREGEARALVVGPWTTAGVASWGAGAEILWVRFALGAFMPHLPTRDFLDSETTLPDAAGRSFWLAGSSWPFPGPEGVETFVEKPAHEGGGTLAAGRPDPRRRPRGGLLRPAAYDQVAEALGGADTSPDLRRGQIRVTCRFVQDEFLSTGYGASVAGKTDRKDAMDYKLELVPLPVADVDRAKAFYAEKAGFVEDLDHSGEGGFRVVQLTPPGSACSIAVGAGIVDTPPGSVQGLHLVVPDIEAARAEFSERGVEVGEVMDLGGVLYAPFSDPDGNGWTLQQLPY